MTIKHGESWGERRVPPGDLDCVESDAPAAALIDSGMHQFLLTGGDMWRTIGGGSFTPAISDDERTVVTVDSLKVSFHRGGIREQRTVFSHAIFESPSLRQHRGFGSKLRRRVADRTFVMNSQFIGDWDIAPRSHPNDGRFEVLIVRATMPWRQRRQFRQRVLTGTHIPHPLIETRSVSDSWSAIGTGHLVLDGVFIGKVENLTVNMRPDSVVVWI